MTSKEQPDTPIEGELVQVTDREPAEIAVASLYGTMTVGQLKKATQKMAEQRAVITEYVAKQLVDGTDYGKIHVVKNCDNKYNCKIKGHYSKSVLFKPGQEKIFSLFNLTANLYRDVETLDMLGQPDGLVALICKVYRGNVEIAEGRGAAKIGDNGRDANSTIKIAEKRARMDACLSLGFSEFFTQDLEDAEYREKLGAESAGDTDTTEAAAPREASQKQKDYVKDLVKRALSDRDAVTLAYLKAFYAANGVPDPQNMTADQASAFIEASNAKKLVLPADEPHEDDQTPPPADTPIEGEIVDDPKQDAARGDGDAMASLAEDRGKAEEAAALEITVDDQLKADIDTMMAELGFSAKDKLAFVRKITGKPYMPNSDADWRAVFTAINQEAVKNLPPEGAK